MWGWSWLLTSMSFSGRSSSSLSTSVSSSSVSSSSSQVLCLNWPRSLENHVRMQKAAPSHLVVKLSCCSSKNNFQNESFVKFEFDHNLSCHILSFLSNLSLLHNLSLLYNWSLLHNLSLLHNSRFIPVQGFSQFRVCQTLKFVTKKSLLAIYFCYN